MREGHDMEHLKCTHLNISVVNKNNKAPKMQENYPYSSMTDYLVCCILFHILIFGSKLKRAVVIFFFRRWWRPKTEQKERKY